MKNEIVTRENVYTGLEVVRGRDWRWENQDGYPGNYGVIVNQEDRRPADGWTSVKWNRTKKINSYRVGHENCFDLYIRTKSNIIDNIENNLNKLENKYK